MSNENLTCKTLNCVTIEDLDLIDIVMQPDVHAQKRYTLMECLSYSILRRSLLAGLYLAFPTVVFEEGLPISILRIPSIMDCLVQDPLLSAFLHSLNNLLLVSVRIRVLSDDFVLGRCRLKRTLFELLELLLFERRPSFIQL